MNIGVGAHITAASPGGPRFDRGKSQSQRASVANGIWLCQNCAKLIDNDSSRYTIDVLLQWKQDAETKARVAIEKPVLGVHFQVAPELATRRRDQIAEWRGAVVAEKYDFVDCRSKFLSSEIYSSLRPHLLPEVIKKIEAPRTFYIGGARGDNVRQYTLLDEIARIERQWGLI